jgi:hypothetical protein
VDSLVDAMSNNPPPGSSNFWQNRTRAFSLAMLQERVRLVPEFVVSCRGVLESVYRALFPLNEQPRGLWALLAKFGSAGAIRSFVHEQLVAGATVALACTRARYPDLDFVNIGNGAPRDSEGNPECLIPHYHAIGDAAKSIATMVDDFADDE